MKSIVVTRPILGICHMQICAKDSVSEEEILEQANSLNPAGTRHGWTGIVKDDPALSPVKCLQHEDRTHYILSC